MFQVRWCVSTTGACCTVGGRSTRAAARCASWSTATSSGTRCMHVDVTSSDSSPPQLPVVATRPDTLPCRPCRTNDRPTALASTGHAYSIPFIARCFQGYPQPAWPRSVAAADVTVCSLGLQTLFVPPKWWSGDLNFNPRQGFIQSASQGDKLHYRVLLL